MAQIPLGPKDLKCPFFKRKMSDVCHTCPNWVHIRGMNPQTGEEMDNWRCAISVLPLLLINAAREVSQGAAATESLRNEVVKRQDEALKTAQNGVAQVAHHAIQTKMIEG